MNARTDNLLHEDQRAERVLPALAAALERISPIICDTRSPVPGFPMVPAGSEWSEAHKRYLTPTPWGHARPLHSDDLGSRAYAGLYRFNLYCLVGQPDVSLPVARAPEPGRAVLDTVTGMATVFLLSDPETPVHNVRLNLDDATGGDRVLEALRLKLAKAGVPVYPVALYEGASNPYPWDTPDRADFRTARAVNKEVTVPLVGYAVDVETTHVVYLHIVGHKSAVRSIWATLGDGGNRKSVSLDVPGRYLQAYSSHDYATYSNAVDQDLGLYRLLIVTRRAIAHEVEDRAYLVVPKQAGDPVDLDTAFAVRLNAVLPIPVLPEWGKVLRQAGDEQGLVHQCASGGDVSVAYTITPDPRWIDLVQGLVRSGELVWEVGP